METQIFSQKWTTTNAAAGFAQPDFARFKLLLNRVGGNTRGYSVYYSLDFYEQVTDEQKGLEKLINFVRAIPVADLRVATIYANLTLDLSTRGRNYNYPVACYKPCTDSKGGLRVWNVWQKKTVMFMEFGQNRKVDINTTLTLSHI